MKRQIMKGFMALVAGVMTLCAASSLFVSCQYDDSLLKEDIENLKDGINDLDERLKAIEDLKDKLLALTARVDALYTLSFQVSDSNELQYSFDGGETWNGTGIILAEECDAPCVNPCECPEVSLVDNGDSVTITIGDMSFTIEKPQEVVFEIKAGKVYFESQGTQEIIVKSTGIEDLTVIYTPKGWTADINAAGYLEVTAPSIEDTEENWNDDWTELIPAKAAATGYVKVHACSVDGKCMVGKLPVEVSEEPVVVKAFGGNYEVTLVTNYGWGTVYFGVSERSNYEADAMVLIDALANYNYEVTDNWPNQANPTASGKIADVLGHEPEVGKEYVVWAVSPGYEAPVFEDLVLAYYSPISVTAVEDESKRTAYDNWITVTVQGANSYWALAIPDQGDFGMSPDDYKEQMVADLDYGGMGKLLTENYEGSFYQITMGSQTYAGEGTPGTTGTLLILPIDGRPNDQYTVADVYEFPFETNPLLPGGATNATVEQVFAQVDWTGEEVDLDPYTELGVKVTASSDTWKYFYFAWMTEDQYATDALGGDSDLIVDFILNNPASYPIGITEFDPVVVNTTLDPGQTRYFTAFFVDENGKYGEVAKMKLTTDQLLKSDIEATFTTNLVDGILKNNSVLEITVEADMELSKVKYVWLETAYYNQYAGKDDAEMADIIYFGTISSYSYFQEILAEDIVDGKFTLEGHSLGSSYYLALLPYDKDGNPGKSAAIFDYDTVFEIDEVITDPAQFVSEPTVVYNVPESMDSNEEYSYYMSISQWGTSVSYNGSYTVTSDAEVLTLFTEKSDIEGMTDLQKASGLWGGSINSYYTKSEVGTIDRSLYGEDAPLEVVIMVSWKDAEGNYYYKEVDLSAQFEEMFINLLVAADADPAVETTPAGKQWGFTVTSEGSFLPAGTNAVVDLGASAPGSLILAAEVEEGVYTDAVGMMSLMAEVKPVSETMGVVTISGLQGFDDDDNPIYGEIDKACYYGLTDTTCSFICNQFFGHVKDAEATTVAIQGGGMMPM